MKQQGCHGTSFRGGKVGALIAEIRRKMAEK